MDTVLFNFHDVLMLLTAFQCLLFALLLTATKNNNQLSNLLLVGFLLCHFFIPLHELMFWGKQFRIRLLDLSPNGFFLFSHAYFLDGPLIYFFVRALLYKDFRLKAAHSWHLLPLAIYAGHMLHSFYLQDHATKSGRLKASILPTLHHIYILKRWAGFYALVMCCGASVWC